MKKFIPILSVMAASACLQNCSQRDEDTDTHTRQHEQNKETLMMREDSTKLPEHIKDPEKDPPVRDGDNWRPYQNNKSY